MLFLFAVRLVVPDSVQVKHEFVWAGDRLLLWLLIRQLQGMVSWV